jgi:hypothetical protein
MMLASQVRRSQLFKLRCDPQDFGVFMAWRQVSNHGSQVALGFVQMFSDSVIYKALIPAFHLTGGIEVADHVILGRQVEGRSRDFVSLRELGYFF